MRTQDDILEAARSMGLATIAITKGQNGYPQDLGDYGITGFSTYPDALQFAEDHGGVVTLFESRQDWQLWSQQGYRSCPFKSDDILAQMGDDFSYADDCDDQFAEDLALIAKLYKGNFGPLEAKIKSIKKINDAVDYASADERIIIHNETYCLTVVKKTCMSFNYDTHRRAIGVLIKYADLTEQEDQPL